MDDAKVVLVTGGARRIGAAIVRRFHAAGFRVIVHYNQSSSDADTLTGALEKERPDSACSIQQDLTRLNELSAFIKTCTHCFGRLDVLVNNASAFYPTPVATLTPAEYEHLMEVNLGSPLFLSLAASATMANGGSIVSIIDIHGNRPLPDYLAYTLSKSGLAMMVRGLALELAPAIRVNGVAPGAILWPESDAEMTPGEQAALLDRIPMGQLGAAEDIAAAVFYLAEDAGHVTGQILNVDGGQLLS